MNITNQISRVDLCGQDFIMRIAFTETKRLEMLVHIHGEEYDKLEPFVHYMVYEKDNAKLHCYELETAIQFYNEL